MTETAIDKVFFGTFTFRSVEPVSGGAWSVVFTTNRSSVDLGRSAHDAMGGGLALSDPPIFAGRKETTPGDEASRQITEPSPAMAAAS